MSEARTAADAARVSNALAPEHLELSVAEPQALAARIRHAGAIFMGRYTAEALGETARIAAQSAGDAERLRALGAPQARLTVTGNLKYDVSLPPGLAEAPSTNSSRISRRRISRFTT